MNSWMESFRTSLENDPLGAVLAIGLLVVLLGLSILGVVLMAKVNSMSDEERKEIGFGPKGQGRR